MSTLQYIPVGKIRPHPDNPRKDLGELEELSESIKANGVLQNLTVVPILGEYTHEPLGTYRAVIGHRRLAAAILAGLETVPCIVAVMTEHEQLKTMIMENMQRADLTLIEQAGAFQMMMDLGDSINSIAKETGFSESTVRRRVKLMELDKNKFDKALQRGGTLMDFAELEKISDPDDKAHLLDQVGTSNFQYALRRVQEAQTARENSPAWIEKLSSFAQLVEGDIDRSVAVYYSGIRFGNNPESYAVPDDAGEAQYYYKTNGRNPTSADIYRDKIEKDSEINRKEEEREELRQMAAAELKDIAQRSYELRLEFVKNKAVTKRDIPYILNHYMRVTADTDLRKVYSPPSTDLINALLEIPESLARHVGADIRKEQLSLLIEKEPDTALLYLAYAMVGDSNQSCYFVSYWNGFPAHVDNKPLDALYSMLEEIGYQISDEEMLQMAGKHPMMHLGKEYEEEDNFEDDDEELEDDEA